MAANPFDNPEFRKEMSLMLKDELKPITDEQNKHSDTLASHGQRLAEHDGKFNRQAGGFVVLGALGAMLEALAHWKWSK